jgi:hypothetical protein
MLIKNKTKQINVNIHEQTALHVCPTCNYQEQPSARVPVFGGTRLCGDIFYEDAIGFDNGLFFLRRDIGCIYNDSAYTYVKKLNGKLSDLLINHFVKMAWSPESNGEFEISVVDMHGDRASFSFTPCRYLDFRQCYIVREQSIFTDAFVKSVNLLPAEAKPGLGTVPMPAYSFPARLAFLIESFPRMEDEKEEWHEILRKIIDFATNEIIQRNYRQCFSCAHNNDEAGGKKNGFCEKCECMSNWKKTGEQT